MCFLGMQQWHRAKDKAPCFCTLCHFLFLRQQTMRMRYRYVTYRYTDGSQQQLEHHYRQLLQEALRQSQLTQRSVTWRPLADIHESAESMTVKIELAGMSEEEIEVTLYEDALVVSGERRDDHEHGENLYYHEAQIRKCPFRFVVLVPQPINRKPVTS